jgi:DNA-binding MarR family transcriptional regulator
MNECKKKKINESPAHKIMGVIHCAHASIRRRMMDKAKELGFSMPQFVVIMELYRNPDITLHELSEKGNLPKSTVSRTIDQLVKSGMVERTTPPDNRRTVKLSTTKTFMKSKARIIDMITADINKKINHKRAPAMIKALEEICEILKYDKK